MIVRTTNHIGQSMLNDVLSQQTKLYQDYDKITSNKKFTNISCCAIISYIS